MPPCRAPGWAPGELHGVGEQAGGEGGWEGSAQGSHAQEWTRRAQTCPAFCLVPPSQVRGQGELPLALKLQPRTHVDLSQERLPGRRPGRRRTRATRVTGGQEGAYGPALGGAELRRTPNKGGPPGSRGGLRAGTMELAGICPGRVVWTGTKVEVGRQPELSGGQPDGRGSGHGGVRRAWNLLEHLCLLACWQDLRGARISGRGPGGPRTRQLPPGTRAGGRAGGAGPGTAQGPLGVLPARAGRLLLARHSPGGPGACTLPSSAAAPLKD